MVTSPRSCRKYTSKKGSNIGSAPSYWQFEASWLWTKLVDYGHHNTQIVYSTFRIWISRPKLLQAKQVFPCGTCGRIDGAMWYWWLRPWLKMFLSSNSNRWLVTSCGPVIRFARNYLGFMETQRCVNTHITSDLGIKRFLVRWLFHKTQTWIH